MQFGGCFEAKEEEITDTGLDNGPWKGTCKFGALELPWRAWDLVSPDVASPACRVRKVRLHLPSIQQAHLFSFSVHLAICPSGEDFIKPVQCI